MKGNKIFKSKIKIIFNRIKMKSRRWKAGISIIYLFKCLANILIPIFKPILKKKVIPKN